MGCVDSSSRVSHNRHCVVSLLILKVVLTMNFYGESKRDLLRPLVIGQMA